MTTGCTGVLSDTRQAASLEERQPASLSPRSSPLQRFPRQPTNRRPSVYQAGYSWIIRGDRPAVVSTTGSHIFTTSLFEQSQQYSTRRTAHLFFSPSLLLDHHHPNHISTRPASTSAQRRPQSFDTLPPPWLAPSPLPNPTPYGQTTPFSSLMTNTSSICPPRPTRALHDRMILFSCLAQARQPHQVVLSSKLRPSLTNKMKTRNLPTLFRHYHLRVLR